MLFPLHAFKFNSDDVKRHQALLSVFALPSREAAVASVEDSVHSINGRKPDASKASIAMRGCDVSPPGAASCSGYRYQSSAQHIVERRQADAGRQDLGEYAVQGFQRCGSV